MLQHFTDIKPKSTAAEPLLSVPQETSQGRPELAMLHAGAESCWLERPALQALAAGAWFEGLSWCERSASP